MKFLIPREYKYIRSIDKFGTENLILKKDY